MGILKKYGRQLISSYVYMDAEPFMKILGKETGLTVPVTDSLDFKAVTQSSLLDLVAKQSGAFSAISSQ